MKEDALYFIAVVPPEPIFGEVVELKKYFEAHHRSKAALRSPPHITLHMPFKWPLKKEKKLLSAIQSTEFSVQPFPVALDGFDSFPPRVIFVNVAKSEPLSLLQKAVKAVLKRSLNIFNADYKDRPYHPHMTVAFRDLRKSEFHKAWPEFENKGYKATFNCNSFWLLKHDGKKWERFIEFQI